MINLDDEAIDRFFDDEFELAPTYIFGEHGIDCTHPAPNPQEIGVIINNFFFFCCQLANGAYQKISDFADEIQVFKERAETAPPGFFTESGEISERESNRLCYEFFTFVYETVIRGREIDWDAIIHHHGLPRQKSEILKSKIFSYFLEMLIARAKELCKDDPSAFRRAIHAAENPDNALKIRGENVEKVAAATAKSGASRGKK